MRSVQEAVLCGIVVYHERETFGRSAAGAATTSRKGRSLTVSESPGFEAG